jgi:hypothetical protein
LLGLQCPESFRPDSPSLEEIMLHEWDIRQKNAWQALDMVGSAARAFATEMKHKREKVGLGLPRRIHKGPEAEPLHHARGGTRHPSPVQYSIRQTDEGFRIRFAAFPSNVLPDERTNRDLLDQLLKKFGAELNALKSSRAEGRRTVSPMPPVSPPGSPARTAPLLTVGEELRGVLMEQNRKGTWTAKAKGVSAPVTNKADVPASLAQGAPVILKVTAVTPNPSFRYLRQGEAA